MNNEANANPEVCCVLCGQPLSADEREQCRRHAQRFSGQWLCAAHQRRFCGCPGVRNSTLPR